MEELIEKLTEEKKDALLIRVDIRTEYTAKEVTDIKTTMALLVPQVKSNTTGISMLKWAIGVIATVFSIVIVGIAVFL